MFMYWWEQLNEELTKREQPEALYGEAKQWYEYRPNWKNLHPREPQIINQVINARKPL